MLDKDKKVVTFKHHITKAMSHIFVDGDGKLKEVEFTPKIGAGLKNPCCACVNQMCVIM